MDRASLVAALAALSLAVALTLYLRRKLGRAFSRRRARLRNQRAARGEVRAETLVERLGYTVEGRQVPCSWTILVDGRECEFLMRADLIVSRAGRLFVAEVKTGKKAPKLSTSSTRRQLLEYRLAYDVDGALLIDAESNRVIDVDFPLPEPRPSVRSSLSIIGAWLVGVAMGALSSWLLV